MTEAIWDISELLHRLFDLFCVKIGIDKVKLHVVCCMLGSG